MPPSANHRRHAARRSARRGYSLLELVLAVALVSGTLASSLALIRDGMDLSREADERALLTNYAVSMLERHTADVAANWIAHPDPAPAAGDLSVDGWADIRYIVSLSDAPANGGAENSLAHIEVTVYWDENADDALGAEEPRVYFRTKIGKFSTYETKASG